VQHPARRLALFAAMLVAACTSSPPGQEGEEPAPRAPDPVLVFDNQSLYQADVYAFSAGGSRVRLGTVQAGRREAIRVPGTALGGDRQVDIVARLLTRRRTVSSGPIGLLPGDSVEVLLQSDAMALSVLPLPRSRP